VIVIQLLLSDAVHPHADATLTETDRSVAPEAGTLAVVGVIEGVHATPFCVTVNVRPAMVSVPVRAVVPE
jgi:hypothetical protein